MLNLPEPERAARRACFANHRHVVLAGAGHMMQRHQPEALAESRELLLDWPSSARATRRTKPDAIPARPDRNRSATLTKPFRGYVGALPDTRRAPCACAYVDSAISGGAT